MSDRVPASPGSLGQALVGLMRALDEAEKLPDGPERRQRLEETARLTATATEMQSALGQMRDDLRAGARHIFPPAVCRESQTWLARVVAVHGEIDTSSLPAMVQSHVASCSECAGVMNELMVASDARVARELDVIAEAVRRAKTVATAARVPARAASLSPPFGQRLRYAFAQLNAALTPPQLAPAMRSSGGDVPIERAAEEPDLDLEVSVVATPEPLGYRVVVTLRGLEDGEPYTGPWTLTAIRGGVALAVERRGDTQQIARLLRRTQLDELSLEISFPEEA